MVNSNGKIIYNTKQWYIYIYIYSFQHNYIFEVFWKAKNKWKFNLPVGISHWMDWSLSYKIHALWSWLDIFYSPKRIQTRQCPPLLTTTTTLAHKFPLNSPKTSKMRGFLNSQTTKNLFSLPRSCSRMAIWNAAPVLASIAQLSPGAKAIPEMSASPGVTGFVVEKTSQRTEK